MNGGGKGSTAAAARKLLTGLALLLLGYLALLAASPGIRLSVPKALQWFGSPGSVATIAIVAAVLTVLALLVLRAYGTRETGAPVAVVGALALISLVLGLASYWNCHDESHPRFFTALMWTADLVKGGIGNQALAAGTCPSPAPVALEIGRLTALAAVFLSLVGVAVALFHSGVDRLRVRLARSVTTVLDLDDEADSMIAAIAQTLSRRSTLVVIAGALNPRSEQAVRDHGARIIHVDFKNPDTWKSLPLWSKLQRLYLLSPDPSANLARLQMITDLLSKSIAGRRIPLIVRIDDPWQAAAWRSQQFGGSQTQWAADTVGKYEVTASRLLDLITADPGIDRIVVCGNSQLTLALCADLARRQLERDYYTAAGELPLPRLTIVAENADEFKADQEFSDAQQGLAGDRPGIEAVNEKPTAARLMALLSQAGAEATAVILVDADIDATTGTRLAARFPETPIYAWDPNAENSGERPVIAGRMRTYRLSMDVPEGQAQDTWERAARLIHDRYAAAAGYRTAATRPWVELDDFYRESNRREVRNALWIVEQIGGHTWNTFGTQPDSVMTSDLMALPPLEQLRLMGFDRDTAVAMARAEHEDWCRYYRSAGWSYGGVRDDRHKVHDKLVDWTHVEADPILLDAALSSLAATLMSLRRLGYRSRPAGDPSPWRSFRRIGTVLARQRQQAWTWTTESGQTMQARPGDWEVREPDGGRVWSVRDDIFRNRYQQVDGQLWRRSGTVRARPARDGEIIDTLEGVVTARAGDWVVEGEAGERWPVPAQEFASRYC